VTGKGPDAGERSALDAQRDHWSAVLAAGPERYGREPSAPARHAAALFRKRDAREVLELGAGQGRDALLLARAGLRVHALDYAEAGVERIAASAEDAGLSDRVSAVVHDVRRPLPYVDGRFDACYAHMLFCMALTTAELEALAGEVRRVLRPGGLLVYTVRTTADPDFGAGTHHGEGRYEAGGFIVHYFDRALVERLSAGWEPVELTAFEEGGLPRRLFRVTLRRPA
jgi:SAM-dependent methyltransferase